MPGFFYFWIMHPRVSDADCLCIRTLIFGFHLMDGIPEDAVHGAQTLIQAYCLCIRTNFSIN